MGEANSLSPLADLVQRLISENKELRQTAVDLVLQTAILREKLPGSRPSWPAIHANSR